MAYYGLLMPKNIQFDEKISATKTSAGSQAFPALRRLEKLFHALLAFFGSPVVTSQQVIEQAKIGFQLILT